MSSLVSVKGPSMTVRFFPEKRTRFPLELGWSPSPASMTPALTNSSLNAPISVSNWWLVILPASESLLALTITITRMLCLLLVIEWFTVYRRTAGAVRDFHSPECGVRRNHPRRYREKERLHQR